MPKLSIISAKKMMKLLAELGFDLIRTKGSHHFFHNSITKKSTVIPFHSKEDLSRGIIKEILREIDLSVEEYERLRKRK